MTTQRKIGLLGYFGIAVIVALVALMVTTRPRSSSEPSRDSATGATLPPAPAVRPVRLRFQPPGPPLFEDLPAELSAMSPSSAEAYLYVDSRVFTRFTAADTDVVACDEGMPDKLLIAADGRVLGEKGNSDDMHVEMEVVSVGEVEATWDGCERTGGKVDERVKVETLTISVGRSNGGWRERCCWEPLAGPLGNAVKYDWSALRTRSDSVRVARGKLPARPRKGNRSVTLYDSGLSSYPDFPLTTECRTQPPPAGGDRRGEIEFIQVLTSNLSPAAGPWWSIHEGGKGVRETCIEPIEIRQRSQQMEKCGGLEDNYEPAYQLYSETHKSEAPLLLVRNIEGLRTGFQPALSIIDIPDWSRAQSVYSDSGEVLRVLESDASRDSLRLSLQFEGATTALASFERDSTTEWSVYWSGFLNGDAIPDVILRVAHQDATRVEHRFQLVLSDTQEAGRTTWFTGDETTLRVCRNGTSIH